MRNHVAIQIGRGCLCGGGFASDVKKRATCLRFFDFGLRSFALAAGRGRTAFAGFTMAGISERGAAGTRNWLSASSAGDRTCGTTGRRHLPRGGAAGCGNDLRTERAAFGTFASTSAFTATARILCGIFTVVLLLFGQPLSAHAEDLPISIERILNESGASVEESAGWNLPNVLENLADLATKDWQKPIRFGIQASGYLLLASVLGLLAGGETWRKGIGSIAVLGFGVLSLQAMMELTDQVVTTAQDCQNYLIAFVPVFSGVAAMGGQSAGSLVYSGMFFAMSEFLATVIEAVLLPVMQIYFCFAACACIWGNIGIEEAAALFAKCMQWILKLCGLVFGFILGVQNVLAGTVDSAALKTGKSMLQGFIPVVGDAAAAALSGAAAAVQLLKGSLALAALLALGTAFVPIVVQCLLYGAAFAGAGIVASTGGQKQCSQLCKLYFEGSKLCLSVLVLYFFMVFLSTALLLVAGNGG